MASINESKRPNGSSGYRVDYGIGSYRHSKEFESREEAEDFIFGPRDREATKPTESDLVAQMDAQRQAKRALLADFLRLMFETCARPREMQFAEWDEFDLDRRMWAIPAAQTKRSRSRMVPLSTKAVAILKTLSSARDTLSPRVFPGADPRVVLRPIFNRLMAHLGMSFGSFEEFRHASIDRMILRHPKLSLAELERIVGRPLGLGAANPGIAPSATGAPARRRKADGG